LASQQADQGIIECPPIGCDNCRDKYFNTYCSTIEDNIEKDINIRTQDEKEARTGQLLFRFTSENGFPFSMLIGFFSEGSQDPEEIEYAIEQFVNALPSISIEDNLLQHVVCTIYDFVYQNEEIDDFSAYIAEKLSVSTGYMITSELVQSIIDEYNVPCDEA
jgi:hypothetical protein